MLQFATDSTEGTDTVAAGITGADRDIVAQSKRILLAEDDAALRGLIAHRLRGEGYDVVECPHGLDLIWRIDHFLPEAGPPRVDLIISDIRMPGANGLEILDDLRHVSPTVPVVLLTAFGSPSTHRRAERLGAHAILDKPVDLSDLTALVAEILGPGREDAA